MVAATGAGPSAGSIVLLAALVALVVAVLVVALLLMRTREDQAQAAPHRETVDAPLSMALRFLSEDHATAAIVVGSPQGKAQLFMRDGALYNALSTGASGDRAVSEALRWDSSVTTVTVIRGGALPAEQNVGMSLADLLRGAGVRN